MSVEIWRLPHLFERDEILIETPLVFAEQIGILIGKR